MAKSGEHWSYARTRSDGTFVLPGVLPTGSVLKLVKPGYCDSSRTLVWSEDLVKISMREATKVAGKVLGSDGKPASGKVRVVYEVSSDTHEEALGDGGVFGVELKHPHRYRLVVTPSGACAKHSISTYSAILSGGHEAQLITLDAKPKVIKKKAAQKAKVKPEPKLGFPASVIDESSELPIKTFKAGTIWVNPNYAKHGPYLIAKGMPKLKSNKQPGYIRLQPPNSPSLQHGGVLVQAKGYAVNLTMLEWDEQAPPRLEIKMVPESVLSGVVRDGDTGEPISGAPVTYYSFTEDRGKRWTNKVTADKAGRFLVRGLRAGHYLLMVAYKGRQAAAQAIDLAVGEERKDLEFQVPSSAVVRGRIQGIEIGDRWEVQLITEGSYRSLEYNPVYRPTGVKVALGKDGAFEIPEVQPGYYEVCVRIPQGAREGGDFLIPIEPIRVRERSLDLDLDASLDRPGSIRGKVTIHGAAIDPARLLVVASPSLQSTPFMLSYGGNVDLSGSRCQVRPDQTFALNAAPGFLGIRVIDMLTGVTLFSSEHPVKLRSGSQMVFDPRLALAVVRVKIEAKTPGASTAASWLDIDVVNAGLSDMAWAFNSGGSDSKKATGISLLGHQGELALLLPPRKVTLRVRSEASRLARPKLKIRNILGEAELTPRVGEQNQVQIQVTVPMTGFDPDPAPKAEDVEGDKAERARKGAGIKVPAVMRVGKV